MKEPSIKTQANLEEKEITLDFKRGKFFLESFLSTTELKKTENKK
ncbi:MAG: hypothetical protein PHN56_04905 [Candidatus Nanoarchaeia archaeon]|nr:hypothetical protein [Candidatus Nanoarchaeia archaeon]